MTNPSNKLNQLTADEKQQLAEDEMKRNDYQRERIVLEIKRIAQDLGKSPSRRQWTERSHVGGNRYDIDRLFGSWNQALALAGLTPNAGGTPTGERKPQKNRSKKAVANATNMAVKSTKVKIRECEERLERLRQELMELEQVAEILDS